MARVADPATAFLDGHERVSGLIFGSAVTTEFDAAVPIDHAEFAADSIPNAELPRLETEHAAWIGPGGARRGAALEQFTESIVVASDQRTV